MWFMGSNNLGDLAGLEGWVAMRALHHGACMLCTFTRSDLMRVPLLMPWGYGCSFSFVLRARKERLRTESGHLCQ